MTDFNRVVEDLADLIADRVVARLAEKSGSAWPGVETKVEPVRTYDRVKPGENSALDELAVAKLSEPAATVESYDEIDNTKSERLEVLTRLGRDRVKELLKAAGEDLRAYGRLSDEDFYAKAVDFEALTGHELDDASEEDITGPEAEDAEAPALTRESAIELDLADLKDYAIKAGLKESSLKGLDTPAIADLLFGEEAAVEEPAEDSEEEEVELDEEEVRSASIGELKAWADEFGIEYTRTTSRNDLVELILTPEED